MHLLEQLCSIHAPSGDESTLTQFLLNYIEKNKSQWNSQPTVYSGDGYQDNIIVVFGKPRTAVWAHMDSVGYTVAYDNTVHPIGAPYASTGTALVGYHHDQQISGILHIEETEEGLLRTVQSTHTLPRGATLSYAPNFRLSDDYVTSPYLDNRLGCWVALQLMETLKDGIVVFSTWEEHGGGSVPYLASFIYKTFNVSQALIADITWVTKGVLAGQGVALSLRDKMIPRKIFVDKIIRLAEQSGIPFQLEVEGAGASDGRELQLAAQPWDWMFIGAPEANAHTPNETVHRNDISSMLNLYHYLMKSL